MKHILLFLTLMIVGQAQAGVSVSVGQPGFYGQINIGDFPRPQLIYPQPVVIHPPHVHVAPVYMHVPPGHAKKWSSYCGQYGACGRPVYFVQDTWYNDVYVPKYKERHGGGGHDKHHDKGHKDKGHGNKGGGNKH